MQVARMSIRGVADATDAVGKHAGDAEPPDDYEMNAELPVLIVDAANVVGSRPDGWWRDRHAATVRLRDELGRLADKNEVVLVVEGRARGVEPAGRVSVVAAPGSGDDEIVRVADTMLARKRRVTVATADRELRRRLGSIGAEVIGPTTLQYMDH
jgi:hypothetical protein